jgi:hypothetical protein
MTPCILLLLLAVPALSSREGAFIGYSELKGEIYQAVGTRTSSYNVFRERDVTVACAGKKVVLTTSLGKINIHLLPNLAPETVGTLGSIAWTAKHAGCMRTSCEDVCHAAAVHALAEGQICPDCRFYRNEEPPPQGSTGPPYGLLQGSLSGLPAIPPPEGGTIAK